MSLKTKKYLLRQNKYLYHFCPHDGTQNSIRQSYYYSLYVRCFIVYEPHELSYFFPKHLQLGGRIIATYDREDCLDEEYL